MKLRKPVLTFAKDMERVLRENDYKGGWSELSLRWLLMRLKQEVGELERAIRNGKKQPNDIIDEAADVANFSMMIADQLRKP